MKGIDKIRQYLGKYKRSYVIIGGTACNLNLEDASMRGRATKDIDMIVVCEAITSDYLKSFWNFIKAGGYTTWQAKAEDNSQRYFYRFVNPTDKTFPSYIELFTRKPDAIYLPENVYIAHISAPEDLSSISAILMDDDYYNYAVSHAVELDGVQVIDRDALIVLKIKAYLNNIRRKESGQSVQSDDIDKHKRDVYRIAHILTPADHFSAPDSIKKDILAFLQKIENDPINTKAISQFMRVPEITQEKFVEILRIAYSL